MNYIKALKLTVAKKTAEIEALISGIQEIRGYLRSEKFQGFENNYVNPTDILVRLDEALNSASAVQYMEPYNLLNE